MSVIVLILGGIIGCRPHDANSDLRLILSTSGIYEVIVLEIPEDVMTPTDHTPERLEHTYHVKLELGRGALLGHIKDLDQALARTECKKPARAVDLRTAIIFLGPERKKIKAFYYGRGGKVGQIDDVPCELSPGLYHWVQKYLPGP